MTKTHVDRRMLRFGDMISRKKRTLSSALKKVREFSEAHEVGGDLRGFLIWVTARVALWSGRVDR